MVRIATIESEGRAWIAVTFTYNGDLKDELMEITGQGNYRYMPTSKQWLYRTSFHDAVVALLERYRYEVDDYVTYAPSPPAVTNGANPWLNVFKTLDKELGSKLYRAATRVLHPDAGGDNDAMRHLNDAWHSEQR